MAKQQGKEVSGFMVNTEGLFITIKKKTQDFSLRIRCLPNTIENVYRYLTNPEIEKQNGIMFNVFQAFCATAIQDPLYLHAFMKFNQFYWEKRGMGKAITVEENEKIIREVEDEYNFINEVKEGKHGEIS